MPSTRVPTTIVTNQGPPPFAGSGAGAAAALLAHLSDPVDAHDASAVSYAGGSTWADGTTNPPSDAESQFDKTVTDLAGGSGDDKVGATVAAVWENSNALGQGATIDSVGLALEAVVTDLAEKTASGDCGADRVGMATGGTWENGDNLGQSGAFTGSAAEAIFAIITDLKENTAANDCGADRVGAAAVPNTWENSDAVGVGSIMDQINQIVGDLAEKTSAAACGARRIGAATYNGPNVDLAQESVLEQLYELADNRTFTATGGGAGLTFLQATPGSTTDFIIDASGVGDVTSAADVVLRLQQTYGEFKIDEQTSGNALLRVLANGNVETTLGRQTINLQNNPTRIENVSDAETVTWDPITEGSFLYLSIGSGSVTWTLSIAGFSPSTGDRITVVVRVPFNSSDSVVTWPGGFVFSGADGVLDASHGSVNRIIKYDGVYLPGGLGFYMTRTDYIQP